MPKGPSAVAFSRQLMKVLPEVMRGFMRTQTNALAKGKISAPQCFVLGLINEQGAMTMTSLARELAVSLPAMSGLVNRLYKMKFIKRIYPEKDRRVIRIDLTPRGRNIVQTINAQREKAFEKIFGQLQELDRYEYLRIILKIKDILYQK